MVLSPLPLISSIVVGAVLFIFVLSGFGVFMVTAGPAYEVAKKLIRGEKVDFQAMAAAHQKAAPSTPGAWDQSQQQHQAWGQGQAAQQQAWDAQQAQQQQWQQQGGQPGWDQQNQQNQQQQWGQQSGQQQWNQQQGWPPQGGSGGGGGGWSQGEGGQ